MMNKMKTLTPETKHIVLDKGTEQPFTGEYCDEEGHGTYLCRLCGLALYRADAKFHSSCGWPSFDEEIKGAVKQALDEDRYRAEILCARCDAHLGHVFSGEQFTQKNLRYCVNSASMDFARSETILDSEEAMFAGGCFWGVQHLFNQLPGVVRTEVGYAGGQHLNPSYRDVCNGGTGHLEAIRVVYDSAILDYETVARYFFEIHDPTQANGQGPDLGSSYLSAAFYYNEQQKKVAESLIQLLKQKGYSISTLLKEASIFWRAEIDHQDYYAKTGKAPYCHTRVKRFD